MNFAYFFNDKGRLVGSDANLLFRAKIQLEKQRCSLIAVYGRMLNDEDVERRKRALRELARMCRKNKYESTCSVVFALLAQNLRQKQKKMQENRRKKRRKAQDQFFLQAA